MVVFSVNRFMAPHDPVGQAMVWGPPPGSQWIGRTFEPFRLRGVDGGNVDSTAILGKRPAVILFHGGRDSPFSMAQLITLAAAKEIRAANAMVYVITIDNPAEIARFARRLWQIRRLPQNRPDFVFARDEYGSFSRQYVGEPMEVNPGQPGFLTRGTFVVGKGRKILYAYVNLTPKLQPSENDLLTAISRAQKQFSQGSTGPAD
jgi:peroxiredoxin